MGIFSICNSILRMEQIWKQYRHAVSSHEKIDRMPRRSKVSLGCHSRITYYLPYPLFALSHTEYVPFTTPPVIAHRGQSCPFGQFVPVPVKDAPSQPQRFLNRL